MCVNQNLINYLLNEEKKMKKIILLVISLVFVTSLFAGASGEADMSYPIMGYKGVVDEGGGLVRGYVGIGFWGPDYGFHFNFSDTAYPGDNFTINHMYKKFTLHEKVNVLVGKTAVPLVKNLNPSVFANNNIIEGCCWIYVNPENDWMIKFDGNVSGLGWQLFTNDVNLKMAGYDYADYGLRLDYNVAGADIGAGLIMRGVPDSLDGTMDWAFDLGYTAAEMVKLNVQLINNDDADDDTSDMNMEILASYAPGLPFWINPVPYVGYQTYDGYDDDGEEQAMEFNEIFFGLKMNPTKDSVLKLEYKMFSEEILDANEDDYKADTLTLQLGYSF